MAVPGANFGGKRVGSNGLSNIAGHVALGDLRTIRGLVRFVN